ncbi:hypothetical protein TTHERM_00814090, partial (macronuclear) [Tetrahymena thermophila SB210]
KSKNVIIVKKCLSKVIPSKLKKLINFDKVSLTAYMKWKIVYQKIKKGQINLQKTKKKQKKQLNQAENNLQKITIQKVNSKNLFSYDFNTQQVLLAGFAKQQKNVN